jgi:hypothetical protein
VDDRDVAGEQIGELSQKQPSAAARSLRCLTIMARRDRFPAYACEQALNRQLANRRRRCTLAFELLASLVEVIPLVQLLLLRRKHFGIGRRTFIGLGKID